MTLFSKNACSLSHFDLQEYQGPIAVLENLQPFSSYAIQVAVKNYYSDEEALSVGEGIVGTTLYGGLFLILNRVLISVRERCMQVWVVNQKAENSLLKI